MSTKTETTTKQRLANAKLTLTRAGYIVWPPPVMVRPQPLEDQCEYPDRLGAPGDCCTETTRRVRRTRFGTLFLCDGHFRAPLKTLFDERVQPDANT